MLEIRVEVILPRQALIVLLLGFVKLENSGLFKLFVLLRHLLVLLLRLFDQLLHASLVLRIKSFLLLLSYFIPVSLMLESFLLIQISLLRTTEAGCHT